MTINQKELNDYCERCEEFNTILDGVCCKCTWNIIEKRMATQEEIKAVENKLEKGISNLDKFLEEW